MTPPEDGEDNNNDDDDDDDDDDVAAEAAPSKAAALWSRWTPSKAEYNLLSNFDPTEPLKSRFDDKNPLTEYLTSPWKWETVNPPLLLK